MFLAVAREIALNPDIGFTAALTLTTRACPHALVPQAARRIGDDKPALKDGHGEVGKQRKNRLLKRGINAIMSAVIPDMHNCIILMSMGKGIGGME